TPKTAVIALDLRTRLLLERSADGPRPLSTSPGPTDATRSPRFASWSICARKGNPAPNLRRARQQCQCGFAPRKRHGRRASIDASALLPYAASTFDRRHLGCDQWSLGSTATGRA